MPSIDYLNAGLPRNESELKAEARAVGVDLRLGLQSVDARDIQSGSMITDRQYYALRPIIKYSPGGSFKTTPFIGRDYKREAKRQLRHDRQFQAFLSYLLDLEAGISPRRGSIYGGYNAVVESLNQIYNASTTSHSVSSLASWEARSERREEGRRQRGRRQQAAYQSRRDTQVQATLNAPLRTMRYRRERRQLGTSDGTEEPIPNRQPLSPTTNPPSPYEATVNGGIWILLSTLASNSCEIASWNLSPLPLCVDFYDDDDRLTNLFQAHCDGYMYVPGDGRRPPLAIIETKRSVRLEGAKNLVKQETAQMVAWIKDYPNDGWWYNHNSRSEKKNRLMVAVDQREAYLIIGEYTEEYERFLEETAAHRARDTVFRTYGREPYLEMQIYGPWLLDNAKEVKHFAKKVLAFMLNLETI